MSVRSSLGWMGLAQLISFVLQFASSVVLAHFLSPHEMGIFAAALAITGMLVLVQTLGLQALIVREEVITADVVNTAFTINALISSIIALSIFLASYIGASLLHDDGVRQVLAVLSITPLIGIASFTPSAMLERSGQFKQMALIGTASSIAGALTTAALAVAHFSYMSLAYSQIVSVLVNASLTISAGRRHPRPRLSMKAWRKTGSFGFQMLAVSGITGLSLKLSDIVLGRIQGLASLGMYNRATAVNGLVWNNIHMVIGRVLLVDFAEAHRAGHSLRERYLKITALATATLWPAFAGLAIIAKPFIATIYGPRWVDAGSPLVFIAAASIILVSITMTWELFTATGKLRDQTRIEFVRAFVALATFTLGCLISIRAAAAARVIDAAFAVLLYRPHISRMTSTSWQDFRSIYAQSGVLTILAVGPAALVMAMHSWAAATPVIELLCSICVGVLFWFGGALKMHHPLAPEIKVLLRFLPRVGFR